MKAQSKDRPGWRARKPYALRQIRPWRPGSLQVQDVTKDPREWLQPLAGPRSRLRRAGPNVPARGITRDGRAADPDRRSGRAAAVSPPPSEWKLGGFGRARRTSLRWWGPTARSLATRLQ